MTHPHIGRYPLGRLATKEQVRMMSDKQTFDERHNQHLYYEIRLQGHLDARWADWFEGLTITLEEDGNTLLTGPVIDQAALHGLLKKVRDLGMPLLSVYPVEHSSATTPGTSQADHSDGK